MKKKDLYLFFFIGAGLFFPLSPAYSLEQKVDDLSAAVEVASVFSLSLDNPNLSFGLVSPGQTKILGEGSFFNEVKCRSNSGRPWYLKAQLVSLRLLEKPYVLPLSYFRFKVVESSGSGGPQEKLDFQEFSEQPALIYVSQGEDYRGREVILRFQYRLSPPVDAPAGNYIGSVVFTMAENP